MRISFRTRINDLIISILQCVCERERDGERKREREREGERESSGFK